MRLFIAFRIFFNSRFYYPVFTILFLDFGLTLSQFALLNAAWAAAIVVMEVPSGALADIIGRRKLLIAAGTLMIMEMLILCFSPKGDPTFLFALFLLNRILSGTAEASASGADEALAYDTLAKEGRPEDWGRVLEVQMRFQSIAYIIAMSLGAAVYDPALMKTALDVLGLDIPINQDITLRIPLFLTLIMSLLTLGTAFLMKDPDTSEAYPEDTPEQCQASVKQAFLHTFQAGRWILQTRFALVVILAGLLFDGVIRMVITLSSQYYRLIQLPEATFGIIGSGVAVLGLFVPRISRLMTLKFPPAANFTVVAGIILLGLVGMMFFIPYTGLIPAVILFSGMFMTGFFVSHYLNRITASHNRATVLSFKGLSFNLSYGIFGIFYSLLITWSRNRLPAGLNTAGNQNVENQIFIDTFSYFPWFFVFLLMAVCIVSAKLLKHTDSHRQKG